MIRAWAERRALDALRDAAAADASLGIALASSAGVETFESRRLRLAREVAGTRAALFEVLA